jgi:hypothetical protein
MVMIQNFEALADNFSTEFISDYWVCKKKNYIQINDDSNGSIGLEIYARGKQGS